jgi:hypothetical protein
MEKEFTENTNTTLTIKDLAGNVAEITVNVK